MRTLQQLCRLLHDNMEKRGLSTVIASVLLILLTISAVGIVISFVVPFVNKSLENTECFEFRDYFKFDDSFGYNCYEESLTTKSYVLTVRAKADNSSAENVIGFNLRFLGEGIGNSVSLKSGESVGDVKIVGNFGGGNIVIPKSGSRYSALSYNYTISDNYEKAEIYATIKGDKICDLSDSIKLKKC